MTEGANETGLKVVDAFDLDDELRSILKPGEMLKDKHGRRHRLPRYFYEVPSLDVARTTYLTTHFKLIEFAQVDIREAHRLQSYPTYIPCAVRILASYLQRLRESLGASMHVAVNGGYRSPGHKLAESATPHMWGTACDLFRIGTTILREQELIQKYNKLAEDLSEDFWVMPYGHHLGQADDHIHLDLGYITYIPREISEDRMEVPQQKPRYAFEERRRVDRRTLLPEAISPDRPASEGEPRQ